MARLLLLNDVAMLLPHEADDVAGAVHDNGKQVGYVATQHAHVERLDLGVDSQVHA